MWRRGKSRRHFGKPSGAIRIGSLSGKRVAFVPRHGEGHVFAPTTLPYRANIFAIKQLGARFIIAVNAVGSLREDMAPGHVVTPDQIIDYTIATRARSFFEDGLVAHIAAADPMSGYLRGIFADAVEAVGGHVHRSGTILVEDGPRFATRAESHLFRAWGCDLIGMTSAPEAFLAREAEIAYASMAHVTDYDSWHETEEAVTSDLVIQTLAQNIDLVQNASGPGHRDDRHGYDPPGAYRPGYRAGDIPRRDRSRGRRAAATACCSASCGSTSPDSA